jgi:hypothetical protein
VKYLAYLPDRHNYNSIPSNRPDQYWFVDKASIAVRVRSPISNPFGRLWTVLFSQVEQESNNSKYSIKLDLKLFEPSLACLKNLSKVEIGRSLVKGYLAHSVNESFYFPVCSDRNEVPKSLIYQLKPIK